MKPPLHDASARQHSGEPSSGLAANGIAITTAIFQSINYMTNQNAHRH